MSFLVPPSLPLRWRRHRLRPWLWLFVGFVVLPYVLNGCGLGHSPDLPSVEEKDSGDSSFWGESGFDGTPFEWTNHPHGMGDGDTSGPGVGGSPGGAGGDLGGAGGEGGESSMGGRAGWGRSWDDDEQ